MGVELINPQYTFYDARYDARYLKLDTSNDPLTNELHIHVPGATNTFIDLSNLVFTGLGSLTGINLTMNTNFGNTNDTSAFIGLNINSSVSKSLPSGYATLQGGSFNLTNDFNLTGSNVQSNTTGIYLGTTATELDSTSNNNGIQVYGINGNTISQPQLSKNNGTEVIVIYGISMNCSLADVLAIDPANINANIYGASFLATTADYYGYFTYLTLNIIGIAGTGFGDTGVGTAYGGKFNAGGAATVYGVYGLADGSFLSTTGYGGYFLANHSTNNWAIYSDGGDNYLGGTSTYTYFGDAKNARIYYSGGGNLEVEPAVIGTGYFGIIGKEYIRDYLNIGTNAFALGGPRIFVQLTAAETGGGLGIDWSLYPYTSLTDLTYSISSARSINQPAGPAGYTSYNYFSTLLNAHVVNGNPVAFGSQNYGIYCTVSSTAAWTVNAIAAGSELNAGGHFGCTRSGTQGSNNCIDQNYGVRGLSTNSGAYDGVGLALSTQQYGCYGSASRSGSTINGNLTDANYGVYGTISRTGNISAGGILVCNNYGGAFFVAQGGANSGTATFNHYGVYSDVSGNAAGTNTAYGVYINRVISSSTLWGFYNNTTAAHNFFGKDAVKSFRGTTNQASLYYDATLGITIKPDETGINPFNVLLGASTPTGVIIDGNAYTGAVTTVYGLKNNRNINAPVGTTGYSGTVYNTANTFTNSINGSIFYVSPSIYNINSSLTNNSAHSALIQSPGILGTTTVGISQSITRSGTITATDNYGGATISLIETNYGIYGNVIDSLSMNSSDGSCDGQTTNYAGAFVISQSGTVTAGTMNKKSYCIYANGTGNASGTTSLYGLYINAISGATTLWSIYNNTTAAPVFLGKDNVKTFWGTTNQGSVYFNATDMVINCRETGTGNLFITGNVHFPKDSDVTINIDPQTSGSVGKNLTIQAGAAKTNPNLGGHLYLLSGSSVTAGEFSGDVYIGCPIPTAGGPGSVYVGYTGTDIATTIFLKTTVDISAKNIVTDTTTGTKIGTATNQKLGFYNKAPVIQQASAANLTNNVTSGGTTDQIDDFTNLTVYATDAATIRNDIYQLARKLKQVNDALRLYGLLS
jgi:hypothetical protein